MPSLPPLSRRPVHSPYMEWAKTAAAAPVPLAGSGVLAVTPAEIPLDDPAPAYTGPSFYGWPPLQEALASYLGAPAGCVVHAVGTSMANHLAFAVLADPGDEVLVEAPCYELVPETARFLGLGVRRFARDPARGAVPDPDEIEARMTPRTRVVALTNLHNPTSARLDAAALRAIADVAARHGAWLLVDEVYREAAFDAPVPTAWGLAENVVVTGSLTKVHGLGGLRCGWLVAPPGVARAAWRLTDLLNVIPAHPAERLSLAALARMDALRSRARRLLGANHAVFNDWLATRPDLECPRATAGTVAFPRRRSGPADAWVRALRERYGTSVVPGSFFGCPDHFRVALGGATDVLREGLARIGRALDEPAG